MKKSYFLKTDFRNLITGFLMGAANVIPGVSGGTVLFIMGAFNPLIEALRKLGSMETLKMLCRFDLKGLRDRVEWRFLIGLGSGVLISFATLAKLVLYMLKYHPQPTFALFLGLIAASIISVCRQVKRWSVPVMIPAAVSAAAAYGVISLVPVNAGNEWYITLLCGAICIIAMILPGLSGSFLLLILGQYDRVWTAVSNVSHLKISSGELSMLFFLVLGAVAGLGGFVHLLNFLMKKYADCTIAALIGFMVGSLPRIWPFQHAAETVVNAKGETVVTRVAYEMPTFDRAGLIVLLCVAAGFVLVLITDWFAAKNPTKTEE